MQSNAPTNCEGACAREAYCKGGARSVTVSGHGWRPIEFLYCQAAIESDRKAGFTVELKQ